MAIWDPDRDIKKQTFGKLTAIKRKYRKNYSWWWLCDCVCGEQVICDIRDLISRKIFSCDNCAFQTKLKKEIRKAYIKNASPHKNKREPKLNTRKNAENERRLVLLAIENISSTKTARERGLGASVKTIEEYTRLPEVAIHSSISWLQKKDIIYQVSIGSWLVKRAPEDNFCFKHGYVELFGGRCLNCLNEKGK